MALHSDNIDTRPIDLTKIGGGDMTKNNIAIMLPCTEMQKTKASAMKVVALEILQENFASVAERDAFMRAMTLHGVTFLRAEDGLIKKIAKILRGLWHRPPGKAVRS